MTFSRILDKKQRFETSRLLLETDGSRLGFCDHRVHDSILKKDRTQYLTGGLLITDIILNSTQLFLKQIGESDVWGIFTRFCLHLCIIAKEETGISSVQI